MNNPHKHAALIKQWADGAIIQYRPYREGQWGDMLDPVWHYAGEYRVKPVTSKYRVALLDNGATVHASNDEMHSEVMEKQPYFVRWLTDWIEYEV